jgi:hypothetical protein
VTRSATDFERGDPFLQGAEFLDPFLQIFESLLHFGSRVPAKGALAVDSLAEVVNPNHDHRV